MTTSDGPEDFEALRAAATGGDVDAQFYLGHRYYRGDGVPQNDGEAVKWWLLAAQQGCAEASYNLHLLWKRGRAPAIDAATALRCLRDAAEWGLARAQARLGRKLAKSDDTNDRVESVEWFRRAAAQDDATAPCWLGMAYAYGCGVERDPATALHWFRIGAQLGDRISQYRLGMMLAEGDGAPADEAGAIELWRVAAAKGDARAHYALGLAFESGRGVAIDLVEAASCYRLAAELGHASAQNNLATLLEEGKGVVRDIDEAIRWYEAAAQQRDEVAEFNLGRIHVRRPGLDNLVRGFAWLCEAVLDGHEPAVAWRDDILAKVSSAQRPSFEAMRQKIESGIRVVKVVPVRRDQEDG